MQIMSNSKQGHLSKERLKYRVFINSIASHPSAKFRIVPFSKNKFLGMPLHSTIVSLVPQSVHETKGFVCGGGGQL